MAEHEVGGVLDLHQAPVNAAAEVAQDGTEQTGIPVERAVKSLDREAVGDFLSPGEVIHGGECVVDQGEADALLGQLAGQPVMAVEVELQAERRPGRHTQIAQPQVGVDEIEVVVQALGLAGLEERPVRGLVVPGPERGARLHGREHVNQTGVIAAFGEDRLDPLLLAEVLALDVFDRQAVLGSQPFGIRPNLAAQGLGETSVVEQPGSARSQGRRHRPSVADVDECPRQNSPVEARERPENLLGLTILDQRHDVSSLPHTADSCGLRKTSLTVLVPAMLG